ncbi:glycosyltransferase family 2 protein [Arthrobacter sp. D3-16]
MAFDSSSAAAVVVHYNSENTLRETLASLGKFFDRSHIIVVDNSSSLKNEGLDHTATIVDDGKNRGYAGGVNRGFELISERLPSVSEVLVCTHETIFRDDAIQQLFTTASNFAEGHIIGPKLVTKTENGGLNVWSNGGRISLPFFYPSHDRGPHRAGLQEVDWVDGAAFVIDIATFKRIGGIPQEFFMYMEDVAVGLLAKAHGVPVLTQLEALVEQSANGPSRALAIRNRVILAVRYMSGLQSLVVRSEIRVRQLLHSMHPGVATKKKAQESKKAVQEAIRICEALDTANQPFCGPAYRQGNRPPA